jgi:hypothetical protein
VAAIVCEDSLKEDTVVVGFEGASQVDVEIVDVTNG